MHDKTAKISNDKYVVWILQTNAVSAPGMHKTPAEKQSEWERNNLIKHETDSIFQLCWLSTRT